MVDEPSIYTSQTFVSSTSLTSWRYSWSEHPAPRYGCLSNLTQRYVLLLMHSSDSSLYGADSDSPLLDAGRDLLDVGGGEDTEAAVEISAPPHLVLLLIDIDHVS